MNGTRICTALLSLASLVLAGCTGSNNVGEPAGSNDLDAGPPTADDGRDLRFDLRQTDKLNAPVWKIGERFGHHVFFGSSDAEGRHFDTIVVEDQGDGWLLATDDRNVAKEHAIIDIPMLGSIKKSDLTMSGFGQPWDFYQFPIEDNASWEFEFPNIAWDSIPTPTVKLTSRASFAKEIPTPDGPRPGFQIQARTADDQLIAEYDFVPAIGWFAHFTVYDIDEGNDPVEFHVTSMGHDYNWTGTYFVDEARPMLEHLAGYGIDPDAPTEPIIEPAPTATFTMAADSQLLIGLVASLAVGGIQELAFVAPSGRVHHWENVGAPYGEMEMLWETAAEAGEWRLLAVGVGAVALAYAELYELVEHEKSL